MGEPMTIDDVRARLEAGRYAHNEDALWADLRALLDDHARLAAEVARLAAALAGYEGKPCGRRDCASARADAREEVERLTRERDAAKEAAGIDASDDLVSRIRAGRAGFESVRADRNRLAAALTCDACSGRGVAEGGPCGCRGNGLPGMLLSVREALYDATRDRDRLAAALAEVREAVVELYAADNAAQDEQDFRGHVGKANGRRFDAAHANLRRIVDATPADLATARDARVRAEALRAAAERWPTGFPYDYSQQESRDWLRAEAERIERGGR